MRAVAISLADAGAEFVALAVNRYRVLTLEDLAAERMLGLEADEENDRLWLHGVITQMVKDSAALTHAGSGDDDGRPLHIVQLLRLVSRPQVAQSWKPERVMIRIVEHHLQILRVITLGVYAKHLGGVHRQRAIHEHVDERELTRLVKTIQAVDDLLGPPHSEGRYQ